LRQLTAPATALSLLVVSVFAYGDDGAWQPSIVFNTEAPLNWQAGYADFGRPGDSAPVSDASDAYRANIGGGDAATDGARVRDPIEVHGKAGYYLYDVDAWAMVSTGPIIGPLRQRSYSLFRSDSNNVALNPLTMGSEYLRREASGDIGSRASWAHPVWSF
jgi:hypothetical protein